MDRAPSHPKEEEFDAVDEQCKVFLLPANTTSLIQPMDQGVISALKRKYRQQFLNELVHKNLKSTVDVSKFICTWSLLNCVDSLYIAWENVTENTLRNSWKLIFDVPESTEDDSKENNNIVQLMNQLPGDAQYSEQDCTEWVNSDNSIPVCKRTSNEELLNKHAGMTLPIPVDENVNGSPESSLEEEIRVPSNSDALRAFTTIFNWYRCQEKSDINDTEYKVLAKVKNKVLIKSAYEKISEE